MSTRSSLGVRGEAILETEGGGRGGTLSSSFPAATPYTQAVSMI